MTTAVITLTVTNDYNRWYNDSQVNLSYSCHTFVWGAFCKCEFGDSVILVWSAILSIFFGVEAASISFQATDFFFSLVFNYPDILFLSSSWTNTFTSSITKFAERTLFVVLKQKHVIENRVLDIDPSENNKHISLTNEEHVVPCFEVISRKSIWHHNDIILSQDSTGNGLSYSSNLNTK